MKKIFQYGFAALAGVMLAGCSGDYEDWAKPQAYGQDSPAEAYGVTATPGNIVMPVEDDGVALLTFSASSDEVVGYNIRELTVEGQEISSSVNSNNVIVSANELEDLVMSLAETRAKHTYPISVDVEYGAILKNGDAVAGALNAIASITTSDTPAIDPAGYFLLGNFAENGYGWDLSEPVWMTSNGDGTYSAIVNTTGDGDNWFKFYEGSHYSADSWDEVNEGQMGCKENGCPDTFGFIVWTGDKYPVETPVIQGKGQFKVTIDMVNMTYHVTRQAVNYYIVGGPNDWAASAREKTLKFNQANIEVPVYTIVFPAAAEGDTWFAIGDDKACDAIANDNYWNYLYGTTNGNGEQGESGTLARRTELADDGSFKIEAGAKYIQVTIDMDKMTYVVKTLNFSQFVYFIGATDGWSKAEQKLETTSFDGVYTGYVYCADPNGWGNEFKFQRVAGSWDDEINSGTFTGGITGDFADAGGNIKATAGEGVYYVTMDLAAGTLNGVKINNMNLVGDFNGWNQADDSQQMKWNATDYCFEMTGAGVTSNGWKFTANNSWDINLGGTVNKLWGGGDNLTVVGSTIKLYPTRRDSDNIYCKVE